jgi:hypothetical protein
VITHVFNGWSGLRALIVSPESWLAALAGEDWQWEAAVLVPSLCALLVVFLLKAKIRFFERGAWFRWAIYYFLIFWMLFFGVYFAQMRFIYSQF